MNFGLPTRDHTEIDAGIRGNVAGGAGQKNMKAGGLKDYSFPGGPTGA